MKLRKLLGHQLHIYIRFFVLKFKPRWFLLFFLVFSFLNKIRLHQVLNTLTDFVSNALALLTE